MDLGNINPVQRPENAAAVRQQSHRDRHRRSAPFRILTEDSEMEPLAENGIGDQEEDSFEPEKNGDRAILSEVTTAQLRQAAMAATQLLQAHEERDGNHG